MNKINSVKCIIDWNNSKDTRYVFRGESDSSYKLLPKLSRNLNSNENPYLTDLKEAQIRQKRLREYLNIRLAAYGHDYHNLKKNDKEWKELFIAQHYGVPTQLLDFTRNPLVALYFSCIRNVKENGRLYAFNIKDQKCEKDSFDPRNKEYNIAAYNLISDHENGFSPHNIPESKFIVPQHFDKRIQFQQSVFCCFPSNNLTTPLDKLMNNTKMESWIICNNNKVKILEELNNLGINAATLFPDLYGLGEFITWRLNNKRPFSTS